MGPTYLVVLRCSMIALSGANSQHAFANGMWAVGVLWLFSAATWTWAVTTTVRAEAKLS